MAEDDDTTLPGDPDARVGPAVPERRFAPMVDGDGIAAKKTEPQPAQAPRRSRGRGVPAARVDPGVVKEFEEEIETKVSTGRRRMRWFANHLILFVACIAAAVPLRLTVFADYHDAFFWIPLAGWLGLLAFHANYAMNPMLRRSKKESHLKAVVPFDEDDESATGERGRGDR